MSKRLETFKCKECNKRFQTDNEAKCPNCGTENVKGIRAGLKFKVI